MRRLIGGFSLMLLFVPALFAQMTMPMPADQKPAAMPDCAAMMQKENAMQQHMADMNAKLQRLVDDMNKAKGSARIEKMEAVINELVTQRAMMQKEMMDMQPQMMQHMMAHMQSAMMKGMADAMSSCPMMQQRNSPAPPPAAEPKH
jgi:TolA-binding protein